MSRLSRYFSVAVRHYRTQAMGTQPKRRILNSVVLFPAVLNNVVKSRAFRRVIQKKEFKVLERLMQNGLNHFSEVITTGVKKRGENRDFHSYFQVKTVSAQ